VKTNGPAMIAVMVLLGQTHADRVQPLSVPTLGQAGFTRLPAVQTGISFTNQLADARAATNRNLLSGSGVAAGDINGDGWCDLYFCGLDNANGLYLNRGNWKFEEIAVAAGVECAGWDSTGPTFADVDNDGDLDLLVNTLGHGTHLFVNDGSGKFQERTAEAGLASSHAATSLALADIEGDGDLDLYVTHFRNDTVRDRPTTRFKVDYVGNVQAVSEVDGRPTTAPDLTNRFAINPETGQVEEYGEEDALYENDGSGHFRRIPFTTGRFLNELGKPLTTPPRDWGLAVQFRDFTGDGAPDLYVCNDYFTPDRGWVNDGKGNFRALLIEALRHTSLSSMGVDFADINRDGFVDFVVVDMFSNSHQSRQMQVGVLPAYISKIGEVFTRPQIAQNTFHLNRGDGTFSEISFFSGVAASEWSWCPVFLDVDLDGWDDLLVSNGHRRDFQNADAIERIRQDVARGAASFSNPSRIMEYFPPLGTAKSAFRNNRDLTFSETSAEWGFASKDISHGIAVADLDNDGDLDVVMNNLGSAASIYRNNSTAPRILVRVQGKHRNRYGIGSTISVVGQFPQTQEIIAGGAYLSGGAPERTFAVSAETVVLIRSRSGETRRIAVHPNHRYQIDVE
jgi:enediyne biosynthesis protein E4